MSCFSVSHIILKDTILDDVEFLCLNTFIIVFIRTKSVRYCRIKDKIYIFGSDYKTRDGTCIRDYLHVIDIAQAHILSLENLEENPTAKYNLGNGVGFTNLEVLHMLEKISGQTIPHELTERRPGDPETLVASSRLAEQDLGWQRKYPSLESIVSSAWDWHVTNPSGYCTAC